MRVAGLITACTACGTLLGFMIASLRVAGGKPDDGDTTFRLARALKEAAMHLRLAGLNTAADLALKALHDTKGKSSC